MKNKPAPITKRLLGQILIDGDFITPHDLQAALETQKDTNKQLGEILVGMGVLKPMDLKAALHVQKDLASFEDAVKAAAGVREILSDLLVQAKRITADQVDIALKEQQKTGENLDEILIRRGWVSRNEVNAVMAFQKYQRGEATASERCRLGEILVATEQITRDQLEEALLRQKNSVKKIGALLVEAGYVQPHQVEHGLKLQHKLVTAALIAALSMANVLPTRRAYAGSSSGSSSEKLMVTATVREYTSMKILNQVQDLVVRNGDIERGYVEIPAASRIYVKSNNPHGYLLNFEAMYDFDSLFDSINVVVGGREVQISPGGGWVPQPYVRGGLTMDLTYRFVLSRNVQPGTYAWPLSISVRSL